MLTADRHENRPEGSGGGVLNHHMQVPGGSFPRRACAAAETYPTDNWGTTESLSYTFDSMGRLNTMTDNIGMTTLISGATYGPANELLTITSGLGGWGSETRTYNSLKQLVALGTPGIYFTYNYPATGNNGKITSEVDGYTGGETITYAYDSLNRLISASSSASWSQTFTYDGFSNLTATVGVNAPGFSGPCCNLNNQDYGEDANGNPWTVQLPAYGTSASASYDIENRLVSLSSGSSYSYDPSNRRVWRGTWYNSSGIWTRGQDEVTFWSISGRKLAAYNITSSYGFYATQIGFNYYFGAKLIQNGYGNDVYTNRLGSVGTFYPYGVERGTVGPNDTEKFTGYFRDAESGNDYADQRYMSPGMGRFLTPDRMNGSIFDPGSLNKYAYVGGDPINRTDPSGQDWCSADASDFTGCDGVGPDQNGVCYILTPSVGTWSLRGFQVVGRTSGVLQARSEAQARVAAYLPSQDQVAGAGLLASQSPPQAPSNVRSNCSQGRYRAPWASAITRGSLQPSKPLQPTGLWTLLASLHARTKLEIPLKEAISTT